MHEHGGLGDPLRIDVGSEVCWVGGWGEAREMADQPGGRGAWGIGFRVREKGSEWAMSHLPTLFAKSILMGDNMQPVPAI